jgi:hypothetical protein
MDWIIQIITDPDLELKDPAEPDPKHCLLSYLCCPALPCPVLCQCDSKKVQSCAVLWIRIRMFLDHPDPEPSIIKQKE